MKNQRTYYCQEISTTYPVGEIVAKNQPQANCQKVRAKIRAASRQDAKNRFAEILNNTRRNVINYTIIEAKNTPKILNGRIAKLHYPVKSTTGCYFNINGVEYAMGIPTEALEECNILIEVGIKFLWHILQKPRFTPDNHHRPTTPPNNASKVE